MRTRKVAPFGTWASPISSDLIASKSLRLGGGHFEGENIYWTEGRPSEGGRNVIVKRTPDGQHHDILPLPFNARSRVHEYGGGEIILDHETVYFSNFADQRLYRIHPGHAPQALTPEAPLRYADGILDHRHQRIICIREDHRGAGQAVNTIAALALDGTLAQVTLVSGNDFYAAPRLSPDGRQLAWLTWNHPNMPWDGTELWIADVHPDGTLSHAQHIAGHTSESITQPTWSPDGTLYFISDRTGWWNLYRWHQGKDEVVIQMDAEFAGPQWNFGQSAYAFACAQRVICTYTQNGTDHLASIDLETSSLTPIETPYTAISALDARPGYVLFRGGSATQSTALILHNLGTGEHHILKRGIDLNLDPGYLSTPQAVEFPTRHQRTAHSLFYLPKNQDYAAPDGAKPPLLVISHGGPTGSTSSALSLNIQYWTSRGFAVLDVNYSGSTGYGRAYREQLYGQWGVVDVEDCIDGALHLVKQERVDGKRLAIRGSSAGGYTTLCALTFHDVFQAGASYYGVANPEALAQDTHKFESRYLDRLIGPYPEQRDIYLARSPLHHVQNLNCPVVFFQGLEDQVVPPNQTQAMVTALRQKGIPVAYLPFEGEQHGFRRTENIKRALDCELYFYARVFNFPLAESIVPCPIDNLPHPDS